MRRIMMSAAFVLAACGPALAEDPYEGEWAGTKCGKNIQCLLEIEKTGKKSYDFRLVAADRLDAEKIVCEAKIPMKRGPLNFTALEQYADALSDSYKSDGLVFLIPGVDGSYLDFFVNSATCDGIEMSGEYGMIGD